jgi:hypothetical protein
VWVFPIIDLKGRFKDYVFFFVFFSVYVISDGRSSVDVDITIIDLENVTDSHH